MISLAAVCTATISIFRGEGGHVGLLKSPRLIVLSLREIVGEAAGLSEIDSYSDFVEDCEPALRRGGATKRRFEDREEFTHIPSLPLSLLVLKTPLDLVECLSLANPRGGLCGQGGD